MSAVPAEFPVTRSLKGLPMTTGSLRVPATVALADLLACPPPLFDVTLDQLRTLLAVSEAGSPLAAARFAGP